MSDANHDDFFVGYLPTPTGLRRFVRVAAALVVLAGIAAAAVLAGFQRDPGDGVWDLAETKELVGVLDVQPCPLIEVRGPGGGSITMLLVGEGKIGVAERVAGLAGKRVTLRGHTLTRGAVRMFELEDGPAAIRVIEGTDTAARPEAGRRVVTLRGEIVDPKCYSGAMKPGDGKTHKGCAGLCLRGGIPAVLVTGDGPYLLVDAAGMSLAGQDLEAVLPYVGDPVEVSGEAEARGDLRVLRVLTVKRL